MVTFNIDLVMIAFAFFIGYLNDTIGPQTYEYREGFIIIDSNYQCPAYCGVNHHHSVWHDDMGGHGMYVNKDELGKKIKKKRNKKKR